MKLTILLTALMVTIIGCGSVSALANDETLNLDGVSETRFNYDSEMENLGKDSSHLLASIRGEKNRVNTSE